MKNKYMLSIIMALIVSFIIPISSWAGEEKELIEVVATGIGKDSDSALKNALRAAIEQAVGTLVDSETLANNDEVVNDQILSYSAGFVESHKAVGEPKNVDGLVTIKIAAQVRRTNLVEKLKAASIHIKEVDGESLFGEVFTALEREQNASEMLKKKFEGFPENILEIKLEGKPKYNQEKKKLVLDVEISVNRERYRSFVKDLTILMEKSASNHQTVNQNFTPDNYGLSFRFFPNQYTSRNMVYICTQLNDARTNSKWEKFDLAQEIMDAIYGAFKRPIFTVDIIDSSEEPIVSGRYNSPVIYDNIRYQEKLGLFIFPVLHSSDGGMNAARPGTVTGKWTLEFDVSSDEMKQMRNVVCKIEKGKR